MGVAPKRSIPALYKTTLRKWYKKNYKGIAAKAHKRFMETETPLRGVVYFFCDEFTNLTDTKVGIAAIQLLVYLGYEVLMPVHEVQLITYLKLANKKLGLLLNFNVPFMKAGIKRKINGIL